MKRSVLAITTLCFATVALSGCGIPVSSSAHALNAAQFGTSNQPQGQLFPNSREPFFLVYFLHANTLTAVRRPDPSASSAAPPSAAMEALDIGPTVAESRLGITSALSQDPSAQVSFDYLNAKTHVAYVSVDNFFINLFGPQLYAAYAQIVFTLVELGANIQSVAFLLNGLSWSAYLPSGELAFRPVTKCDYAILASLAIQRSCGLSEPPQIQRATPPA